MSDSIILFDGVCNLCNGSVQFIIRRDPQAFFRFAALQSPIAATLLRNHSLNVNALESVLLIEGDRIYSESDAALRIARRLSGFWSLFYFLVIVPRPIRDWVYRLIARNRYRWFGKQESCMIPTPALRSRFID